MQNQKKKKSKLKILKGCDSILLFFPKRNNFELNSARQLRLQISSVFHQIAFNLYSVIICLQSCFKIQTVVLLFKRQGSNKSGNEIFSSFELSYKR